jgi:hypothetical protein
MRLKNLLLATVSALWVFSPCVTQAQQTPSTLPPQGAGAADQQIETVLVTGLRSNLENAIDTKRGATAIIDTVSVEDIGKFPEQNPRSAELLGGISSGAAKRGGEV